MLAFTEQVLLECARGIQRAATLRWAHALNRDATRRAPGDGPDLFAGGHGHARVVHTRRIEGNAKPFLNVSGDRDIGGAITPASMAAGVNAATQPGAWVYYHQVLQTGGTATGHRVLMMQPERVTDMTVAWWKWQLKGDQQAKSLFVGPDCGLCNRNAELEYGHNSRLQ